MMEDDNTLHELYRALSWRQIKGGDLEEALKYALLTIEEREDNPDDEYIFALGNAGGIYEGLGDFEKALYYNELCLQKTLENHERDSQDPDNIIFIAIACMTLGRLYQKLSRMEDAFYLYQLMYAISTNYLIYDPEYLAVIKLKMIACQSIADFYLRQETPSNAYPFCMEYKSMLLEIKELNPDDIDVINKINFSNILLGDYYDKSDDADEALKFYLEAERGAAAVSSRYLSKEELANYADLRATHALAHEKLSTIYFALKNYGLTIEHNSKNQEILEKLVEEYGDNIVFRHNLSVSLQQRGIILYQRGDFLNALDYFEKCFAMATDLVHLSPDSSDFKRILAIIYQYRAIIHTDTGELDKAETNYKAMYNYLKDLTKIYPGDPLMKDNLAYACTRYAYFIKEERSGKKFKRYLEEAHGLYEKLATELPGLEEYREKADMAAALLQEAIDKGLS
jgi:tetratricopeptide (TPR) repeat protein